MKIFRFLAIALVAMLGFTACEKHECDFIETDRKADLVGTWTCHEAGFAQAFVFKADGTATTTGVENGEFWENVNITWKLSNNKLTLNYGDNTSETLIDIIPGSAMSIADKDGANRRTFQYCANDLSDEIVGMWVWQGEDAATIQTFTEDGKLITTSAASYLHDNLKQQISEYRVVGDLRFHFFLEETIDHDRCVPARLVYTPNGTAAGDIMSIVFYATTSGDFVETTKSFLRVKQSLDLAGQKYDYIKTFVTNVKGLDKDINFMGFEFNFAKMDGVKLDKMLKTLLFAVEFPTADSIKYSCHYNGEYMALTAPIAVDGNKMTVKMSDKDAAYKDVDLYTFQDADCSQMHMYMPTYAFINFFGNMQATMMSQMGQLDLTNAEAVKAVFDSIDDAVETINVSFVMEKAAK